MKKITKSFFTAAALSFAALLTFSCSSLQGLMNVAPSLSMQNIGIKGLDLEGITFNCNYTITNPYPVAFSIKEVAGNLLCDGSAYANISTGQGISVAAMGSKTNSVNFKIPYDKIISLAKATSSGVNAKSLPFTFDGKVSLDLSKVTSVSEQTLSLPFTKSFDVPVFKPSLSVANARVKIPTLNELKDTFVNSGMALTKAASLATSIISGNGVSADLLDDVDINFDLLFDLDVASTGGAAWNFIVNNCSLQSATGSTLADVSPVSASEISSNGKVAMKASLNTLKSATLIAQLLNKSGSNPKFVLDSGLSFPDLSYASKLPLAYTYELPLSSVSKASN